MDSTVIEHETEDTRQASPAEQDDPAELLWWVSVDQGAAVTNPLADRRFIL